MQEEHGSYHRGRGFYLRRPHSPLPGASAQQMGASGLSYHYSVHLVNKLRPTGCLQITSCEHLSEV